MKEKMKKIRNIQKIQKNKKKHEIKKKKKELVALNEVIVCDLMKKKK